MTKTLADFKRDINIGDKLQVIEILEDHMQSGLVSIEIPEKLKPLRIVSYKDTTGFYLKTDAQEVRRGSFCGYPKADDHDADYCKSAHNHAHNHVDMADVCELAHTLTVRECEEKNITVDSKTRETGYTVKAQWIYDYYYATITSTLNV